MAGKAKLSDQVKAKTPSQTYVSTQPISASSSEKDA